MKLPDIVPGTRVTAALLTKIARQANVGAGMRAGRGLSYRNMPGGPQLSLAAQELLAAEPAQRILVVNTGQDAIDAYCPAGIIQSLGQLDGELQSQRVLSVRFPKARDAGDIVIAAQRIEPGGAGWAYCAGTCLVRLFRWYQSELLDKADIIAGQRYALSSIEGALDILWSQKNASGDLIVNAEHFAVVRFNGRRQLRWFNSGTTDVTFGSPICLLKSATDGMFAGVLTARAPNSSDTLTTSFINLGGTVKSGEYGKCTAGIALARAKASYNSLSTVGAEQGQLGISSAGSGWTLIARMGASPVDGLQYVLIAPAGGSSALYTLQIIGGNTLSDGSTLGIKNASAITTLPVIYDPNTSPACIDGIGYGTLFVNSTNQGRVLIANFTGDGSPYQLALMANQVVFTSAAPISIPLATDATQSGSCYLPFTP